MAKKNETIIKIENISKSFGDKVVLNNINLEIKRGEFVTLLGPSGCGKTTLLRMLAGFTKPDEGGVISMEGKNILDIPPHQRPLNTVFQRYALFPHLDVFENIAFGLQLKKVPAKEIETRVRKALKMVSMTDYEDRDVNSLSGGQQQRVAIARAIVNQPQVLLLDEPLAALDLKMRKDMQMELKQMHEALGITFIYVTHDQEEALTLSDTIVVMSEGEIQQIGSPADIYNEPANSFVADFIGESMKSEAVVETNHRGCEIFDGIFVTGLLAGHFPCHFRTCRTVAAEVVVGHAVRGYRLRIACEIAGKVDYVYAEVDQRTAAGVGLVAEPAARAAVSAEIGRLRVVDVAHRACGSKLADGVRVTAETAYKTDLQELSGFLGNCEHFFRFFGVHRHRLFADNICTAAESSDGRTLVRRVPRRDAYAVEVFLRHHFVVVGVGTRDVVAFRIPLQLCFVNVASRNDFHTIRQCQIAAHMRIADAAGTDDTNLDLFHEIPPYDRFFLSYCQRLYHNRRNLSIF